MRHHLNDHAAGTLQGDVPASYRTAHGLDLCSVCGLLVAQRYHGSHPKCRPEARRRASASGAAASSDAAAPGAGPDVSEVLAAGVPVLRHVPKAARGAWAQCLARALAAVAADNSLLAWRELLLLLKAVLRPAPRGGAQRRQQAAQFTARRCGRWLEGEREELWDGAATRPRKTRAVRELESDAAVDPETAARHARDVRAGPRRRRIRGGSRTTRRSTPPSFGAALRVAPMVTLGHQ